MNYSSDNTTGLWPQPRFHFEVKFDSVTMFFQEVTGLEEDNQTIQYRADKQGIKLPGIRKFGNITMKKGIFKSDNKFWDWFNQIKMNIKRIPVTINLLDEEGNITMSWILSNAMPIKITSADLKSDGNEVSIESIELSHEGLTNK